jgi:hypothetical protein
VDESKGPGERANPAGRLLLVVVGVCFVFCLVVAVLLKIMPGPKREVDYLVIGGLATLVAMIVLFLLLARTSFRGETFYRKRKQE